MQKNGYKDLIVWQKSVALVMMIYDLVSDFPKEEIYGLASQMKRASISIPSNLAEGSRRSGTKDMLRFFMIAFGSASELETQLIIAEQLRLGKSSKFKKIFPQLEEVLKMLNKMTSQA